ncbi:hypothetical protein WA026_015756 [Henosepilachna vigintioctopunctata]|uniref:Uncharacterized protein n=1 Tax=Henosepilachna vigintioctopunctata TaxID=420089 RepID=A0AAW1V0E6_9CUCU
MLRSAASDCPYSRGGICQPGPSLRGPPTGLGCGACGNTEAQRACAACPLCYGCPRSSSSSSIFELDEKLDSVSFASNSEQSIAAATLPILITQDTAPQETNACVSNPKDTISSITSSDTGSSANIDNVALKPLTLTVDVCSLIQKLFEFAAPRKMLQLLRN